MPGDYTVKAAYPEPPTEPEIIPEVKPEVDFTEMEYPESPVYGGTPWENAITRTYQELYGGAIQPTADQILNFADKLTSGIANWSQVQQQIFAGAGQQDPEGKSIKRMVDGKTQVQYTLYGGAPHPQDDQALAYMRNYLDVWNEWNRIDDVGMTADQYARMHYQTYGQKENRFWGAEANELGGERKRFGKEGFSHEMYQHDSRVPKETFTPVDLRSMPQLDYIISDPDAHLRKSAKETFKRNLTEPARI